MRKNIKAILWDFGGVLTHSPLKNFEEYEKEDNIPLGTIIKINSINKFDNAWAKLEKNIINKQEFTKLFLEEAKNLKINAKLDVEKILSCLNVDLNPDLVSIFFKLKNKVPCYCLTNNISYKVSESANNTFINFKENFINVFESSKIGFRKPEKKIYKYVLKKLNIAPENILFIDDLGINLKPAKLLGFQTYKVVDTNNTKLFLLKLLEEQ